MIITRIEKAGVCYEIEQFAYPLNGPPPQRRGDMPMVLLQKVRVTELRGKAANVPIRLNLQLDIAGKDTDLAIAAVGSTLFAEATTVETSPCCSKAAAWRSGRGSPWVKSRKHMCLNWPWACLPAALVGIRGQAAFPLITSHQSASLARSGLRFGPCGDAAVLVRLPGPGSTVRGARNGSQ